MNERTFYALAGFFAACLIIVAAYVLLVPALPEPPATTPPQLTGGFDDEFMGFGYRLRNQTIYVTDTETHRLVKILPFEHDVYGAATTFAIGGDYFFIVSGGVMRAFDDSDTYYYNDELRLVKQFTMDMSGKAIVREGSCIAITSGDTAEQRISFDSLEPTEGCTAYWEL